MPFTPRVRVLLMVLVLACAAVGAGLMVLGRRQSTTDASPGKSKPPAATLKRPSAARPSPQTRRVPSGGGTSQAASANRLPASIREALAANRVVVVALFDPNAKIAGTAMREAEAGALLTGTTFVSVDVSRDELGSLNARYGVIEDPAVLVLRPPGDLVFRIDGFADRNTVAQAAANAAS
jgi:hypothetical protein